MKMNSLFKIFNKSELQDILDELEDTEYKSFWKPPQLIVQLETHGIGLVLEVLAPAQLKKLLKKARLSIPKDSQERINLLHDYLTTEQPVSQTPSKKKKGLTPPLGLGKNTIKKLQKLLFHDDLSVVKKGCEQAAEKAHTKEDYYKLFPQNWDTSNDHNISSTAAHYRYLVLWRIGHIAKIDPEFAKGMNSLNLKSQELSELPDSLGNLTHLRNLQLGNNHLGSLPESLGDLKELEALSIEANPLRDLPKNLENLPKLQRITLGCNQFSTLPLELLSYPSLKQIQFVIGLNGKYVLHSDQALPIEFAQLIQKNGGSQSFSVSVPDFWMVDDCYTSSWLQIVNLHGLVQLAKEQNNSPALSSLCFQGPQLHNLIEKYRQLNKSQWTILKKDLPTLHNLNSVSFETGGIYEFTPAQLEEMFEILSKLPNPIDIFIEWKALFDCNQHLPELYKSVVQKSAEKGHSNLNFQI